MLFGSYNGDWDNTNNILRTALAAATHPLAVMWAGRPFWQVHHMALGEDMGYATLLSQTTPARSIIRGSAPGTCISPC